MRLSCSIDGKAELIPDISTPPATVSSAAVGERSSPTSGSTPCHPSRPREFRRSYSATTAATASMNAAANGSGSSSTRLPSISTLLNPAAGSSSPTAPSPLPRGPSGRSRNVEAWESCAASQTRDELTAMAEKESNGDAAARISLIRSASGSHHHANALQPSSGTKRNDAPRRHAPAAKRAKFSRATSSLARLEGAATAANPDPKKPDGDDVWLSPTADSDKENWSPVNEARQSQLPTGAGSVPRKQSVPPVAPLQDASSRRANSNLARAGRMRLAKDAAKGGIAIFDEAAARPGEDVERFMRGSVSPSKKGDLEVVSSLLSLSKGAWE